MAVKNHALDEKIIRAARAEFLEHGFRRASLHKIAERAGLTTGALYTRYKNKDALFCSLVDVIFRELGGRSDAMRKAYAEAGSRSAPEDILAVIRREEQVYLDLLFREYDACVLFFCRSDGSSVETLLNTMLERKARETVAYLKGLSRSDLDLDGVELLMTEQFHAYRQILEKGYSREKALACLKTVEVFQEAGWKALFQQIL